MSDETNTYVIDHESGAEMQRLIDQDKLLNKHMGNIFPDGIDPARLRSVLDVACGPAAWILNVAFLHRHIQAVGIDISQPMIDYGRAFARVQHLENAQLHVMNVLEPLEFADNSFDFVNGRLFEFFVKEQHWSPLLQELQRVTVPGGYLRQTELFDFETNSPACNRHMSLLWEGLKRDGRVTLTDAQGNPLGIGSKLTEMFAAAGITVIGEKIYTVDWSWGTDAHYPMIRDVIVASTLVQPYLVNTVQIISKEEHDQLLQTLNQELYAPAFKAISHFKSVLGQKAGGAAL
ncbi:MAG TPA: methyltransferase domain-containing protein [Ktedonobacteraceae bacterium]|nr:methyltransferase domain-containing protein [Ktedonobacteraceae bacterium]